MLKHLLITHDKHHFLPAYGMDAGHEIHARPGGIVASRRRARQLTFVGLEHTGGVMVFDVTEPAAPRFVGYTQDMDFGSDPD